MKRTFIAATLSLLMLGGCGGLESEPAQTAPGGAGGKADSLDDYVNESQMQTFASAEEFDSFVQTLKASAPAQPFGGPLYASTAESSTTKSTDSITNNQEAGVDEGDIVKAHGKHLVILRRGRLFSVKLGDDSLTPVAYVDAFPAGSQLGTWYDEMLIHNDTIVVVGYSYKVSATEIGLFEIDAQGAITHKSTYFLRSNDYYSSRNYASRLVDGKLVFYMPYFLLRHTWGADGGGYEATLPGLHSYPIPEESNGWLNIIDKTTIYKPVQKVKFPALHTIVTCDLSQPQLSCSAQGIVGPYSRNFYVSADAVYLWVAQGSGWFFPMGGSDNQTESEQAVVYRLPLDGSNPGAVRAVGHPTDQFSFKQSSDNHLNVLVRANGNGEWMWAPEITSGDVGLLRIPVSLFKSMVKPVSFDKYTTLTTPAQGYIFQNRFVGDHVLYGTGNGWWNAQSDSTIYVHNYKYVSKVTALKLQHSVDRIEVMDKDAVVIGGSQDDLHFTAVELGWYPHLAGSHVEQNAVQGETRSHGFFYKKTGWGTGILGLPVREGGGQGWHHLVQGSAKVVYLRVVANSFLPLGSLDAKPENAVDDNCLVSCVDWYGNARPIFYDGRIFALLGYELVEGQLSWWASSLSEIARVDMSSVLQAQ
jgi:hypothetical protein